MLKHSGTKTAKKINGYLSFLPCHNYDWSPTSVKVARGDVQFVRIQFTSQNDSADAIKADWKWIQTGSVNSH